MILKRYYDLAMADACQFIEYCIRRSGKFKEKGRNEVPGWGISIGATLRMIF